MNLKSKTAFKIAGILGIVSGVLFLFVGISLKDVFGIIFGVLMLFAGVNQYQIGIGKIKMPSNKSNIKMKKIKLPSNLTLFENFYKLKIFIEDMEILLTYILLSITIFVAIHFDSDNSNFIGDVILSLILAIPFLMIFPIVRVLISVIFWLIEQFWKVFIKDDYDKVILKLEEERRKKFIEENKKLIRELEANSVNKNSGNNDALKWVLVGLGLWFLFGSGGDCEE